MEGLLGRDGISVRIRGPQSKEKRQRMGLAQRHGPLTLLRLSTRFTTRVIVASGDNLKVRAMRASGKNYRSHLSNLACSRSFNSSCLNQNRLIC